MQATELQTAALVMLQMQSVESELAITLRNACRSGDKATKNRAILQLSDATRFKQLAEQTFSQTQASNDE